jgi:hypothetical protein
MTLIGSQDVLKNCNPTWGKPKRCGAGLFACVRTAQEEGFAVAGATRHRKLNLFSFKKIKLDY